MDPDPELSQTSVLLLEQLVWWPDLTLQFFLFVILIFISFLASGSEIAFFSLTKKDLDKLEEEDTPSGRRILRLLSHPDKISASKKLLATILITNNFMNVAAILVASQILKEFQQVYLWNDTVNFLLNVVVITSVLLFFGEIIPKVYASKYSKTLVHLLAGPFEGLKYFLSPFSRLLIKGTRFIDNRIKLKETHTSLEDLKHAIELTTDDVADKEEKGILKSIVNFSNIPVKSIMRARVDVIAFELNEPLDEILNLINKNTYSRLPVYEENLDNIKGILHIKDLLPYIKQDSKKLVLKDILREVYYVPESKKIDDLLEDFKTNYLHMAVIVDEFGGTAGIVTLEDVIEEIFGEINDEFDSMDWVYTKKSEDTYIFEGRISLIDVRKILNLDDQIFEDARGDSDSLGGLILELHGKIPEKGDLISYQNFDFIIEAISRNRISQIKMVIKEEEELEEKS
ncbi:MAG: gliding motility-associated protein GldE [Bacteroidia bacterium]|nr:gliding motility-associated protein GldE [Bacteroidia bacterium]